MQPACVLCSSQNTCSVSTASKLSKVRHKKYCFLNKSDVIVLVCVDCESPSFVPMDNVKKLKKAVEFVMEMERKFPLIHSTLELAKTKKQMFVDIFDAM